MRKLLSFIFLMGFMFFFTLGVKSQEIYNVNAVELNVREGAGTEYPVIGKLKYGQEVTVYEVKGNWAKIYFFDKEGYVNKNFLVRNVLKSKSNQEEKPSPLLGMLTIASMIVGWVMYKRYTKRCTQCKKWNAMEIIKMEKTGEKPSSLKKTAKITDIKGKAHYNTYYVPATTYYYDVYRQCKYCGYIRITQESLKREN